VFCKICTKISFGTHGSSFRMTFNLGNLIFHIPLCVCVCVYCSIVVTHLYRLVCWQFISAITAVKGQFVFASTWDSWWWSVCVCVCVWVFGSGCCLHSCLQWLKRRRLFDCVFIFTLKHNQNNFITSFCSSVLSNVSQNKNWFWFSRVLIYQNVNRTGSESVPKN